METKKLSPFIRIRKQDLSKRFFFACILRKVATDMGNLMKILKSLIAVTKPPSRNFKYSKIQKFPFENSMV